MGELVVRAVHGLQKTSVDKEECGAFCRNSTQHDHGDHGSDEGDGVTGDSMCHAYLLHQ